MTRLLCKHCKKVVPYTAANSSIIQRHLENQYRRKASQLSLWHNLLQYLHIVLSFNAYDISYSESRTEMAF